MRCTPSQPSRKRSIRLSAGVLLAAAGGLIATQAAAVPLQVSITNLAPDAGTYLTPTWFGVHNGNFDVYNRGTNAAGTFVEPLAEDGVSSPTPDINNPTISPAFAASGDGIAQGTLAGPASRFADGTPVAAGPIGPGATAMSGVINVDDASGAYFSYGAMVIPSNDFFIANGDPRAHPLFDAEGNLQPLDFFVLGADVLDAGTEVNDESTDNAAFLTGPNLGNSVDENGVIGAAAGFESDGPILSFAPNGTPIFGNAQFTADNYRIAEIRVSAVAADVPEPSTWALMVLAAGMILVALRRRTTLKPRQGYVELENAG